MWRRRPILPCDVAGLEARAPGFLRGRAVRDFRLLEGGRCNSNYRFRVGDEDFVLRLYARGDARAPARERAAMALAGPLVPVAGALAFGDDWVIGRFLPGVTLDRAPTAAAIRDAGRTLAAIASVRLPARGDLGEGGGVIPWRFDGGLEDGGDDFNESCLARPRVREALGDLVEGVRALLRRAQPLFEEMDAEVRLVHGDFRPDNLLVDGDRVTGVLDWEFAHAGSTYMDLGNLLRHLGPANAPAIEAGLRDRGHLVPEDWVRRAGLFDLSAQLEFLASDDVRDEAFRRSCVDRIRALL